MDNLRRRKIVVNGFPMCLRDEESVNHLLLNCSIASTLWYSVADWFGCSWVFPDCILDHFLSWKSPIGSSRGKEMWRLSFLAVLDHLEGKKFKMS